MKTVIDNLKTLASKIEHPEHAAELSEFAERLIVLRTGMMRELQELQADYEELTQQDLLDCREAMHKRVNRCLEGLEESDEDNAD